MTELTKSEQQKQAGIFYRYVVNQVVPLLLAPEDIVSLYRSKKLLKMNNTIHRKMTAYMSEISAARMLQMILNLATITYQYGFASWFVYFVTSISGLKKIYKIIFRNPLYAPIFYTAFYLRVLEGTVDETKFNVIAQGLGLPKHIDAFGNKFLTHVVNILPQDFAGVQAYDNKTVSKILMKKIGGAIAGGQAEAVGFKGLDYIFGTKVPQEVAAIDPPAVYIKVRDQIDYDDTDIQEHFEYIRKNRTRVRKELKKKINPKRKRQFRQALRKELEIRRPTGEIVCLNECKRRVKTNMGCYCDSDCASTTFLSGRTWCWVDPKTCPKKAKSLPRTTGLTGVGGYWTYDYCDPKKLSETAKCFSGDRYVDCKKV